MQPPAGASATAKEPVQHPGSASPDDRVTSASSSGPNDIYMYVCMYVYRLICVYIYRLIEMCFSMILE